MNRLVARLCLAGIFASAILSAADVTGIWTGQMPGRRGEPEDVAFRFKLEGATLSGKMLGDELDIPIEDATVMGDQVKFFVTITNYYSGNKSKLSFSGKVDGSTMNLVREREPGPDEKVTKPESLKQELTLKKLT